MIKYVAGRPTLHSQYLKILLEKRKVFTSAFALQLNIVNIVSASPRCVINDVNGKVCGVTIIYAKP